MTENNWIFRRTRENGWRSGTEAALREVARVVLADRGPSAQQPFHPLGESKVPPRLRSEYNLLTHNQNYSVTFNECLDSLQGHVLVVKRLTGIRNCFPYVGFRWLVIAEKSKKKKRTVS